MDATLTQLDWSLVQTFVAVAETGSLSDAARQLGSSQPTVGRQIKQLESLLEVTLFQRHPRGLSLSETGHALLPHAQRMRDGMHGLSLTAASRSEKLSGPVRLTASVFVAQHHLPGILSQLRRDEPEISIDLVATDETENLLFREADIAVRMFRSEQLDVVTRYLGELEIGLYAAKSLVERFGTPENFDDTIELGMVGFDRNDAILRGMQTLGIPAQRDWFATRCDQTLVYWELVRAGCGAGFVMSCVADHDPGVVRLPVNYPIPTLPLWLAAHEAVRTTPRIRRVWTALEDGLRPLVMPR
ncbi:LysR family transcriptional regulator [Mesobacterium sp. TK19101]|uniref:LysR family transcriptional regulator n=1 Tax=Mesobacterium hydrothermale TaxID=3111907 RepID=A0ABU6HE45_9RHOB|nr:LysR family transcriptional regulator [Mesobacterium sp. TK19101]MEC3860733.1 LysR family transcriptional regulator [Mesobacterium sp. TK19101]